MHTCLTRHCTFGRYCQTSSAVNAEDRCNQTRQRLCNPPHRGLRAALRCHGYFGANVYNLSFTTSIYSAAEVRTDVLIQRLVSPMELEVVIGLADCRIQLCSPRQNVLVERLHLAPLPPHRVAGSNPSRLLEQKAQRIPQLAIVLTHALHQVLTRRNVLTEVHGRNPKPDDLTTQPVRYIHRIDAIAQRLRKRTPLLIQRPSGLVATILYGAASLDPDRRSAGTLWNHPRC